MKTSNCTIFIKRYNVVILKVCASLLIKNLVIHSNSFLDVLRLDQLPARVFPTSASLLPRASLLCISQHQPPLCLGPNYNYLLPRSPSVFLACRHHPPPVILAYLLGLSSAAVTLFDVLSFMNPISQKVHLVGCSIFRS